MDKDKNTTIKVEEPKHEEPKIKYRYYCEACTGIGFYAENTEEKARFCHACGFPLGKIKHENFIKI